jgi:hypothetical protein
VHKWLCGTGVIGVFLHVFYAVMCIVLLSVGVVWNCVNILYSDCYVVLNIGFWRSNSIVHLFILMVRAINMEFCKASHI